MPAKKHKNQTHPTRQRKIKKNQTARTASSLHASLRLAIPSPEASPKKLRKPISRRRQRPVHRTINTHFPNRLRLNNAPHHKPKRLRKRLHIKRRKRNSKPLRNEPKRRSDIINNLNRRNPRIRWLIGQHLRDTRFMIAARRDDRRAPQIL